MELCRSHRLLFLLSLMQLLLPLSGSAHAEVNQQPSFGVIVEWNGELKLAGYVPSESDIESIAETAQNIFPGVSIENTLQPGSKPDSGWSRNGRWGMSQLKKLESGVLEYSGSYVFLQGTTDRQSIIDQIEAAQIGLKPEVQKRLNLNLK